MTQYRPVQTSCLCLTIVRGFKCLSVLKCWEPLLSCVPHWPRFQLFSAWNNGRNGFITEHNTWVLFNTIVVTVLIAVWFCAEHWVFSLCNLLKQPANDEPIHCTINLFKMVQQMIVCSHEFLQHSLSSHCSFKHKHASYMNLLIFLTSNLILPRHT